MKKRSQKSKGLSDKPKNIYSKCKGKSFTPAIIFHDDNNKVFESNSIMNKVTKESIDKKIASVETRRITDKLTHCLITMNNGFQVTGESACVDPANYDEKIGRGIAFDNAFNKLWEIEGYLLQEKLSLKKSIEAKAPPGYWINLDEAFNINAWAEFERERENTKLFNDALSDIVKRYPLTPAEAFKKEEKFVSLDREKKVLAGVFFYPDELNKFKEFYAGIDPYQSGSDQDIDKKKASIDIAVDWQRSIVDKIDSVKSDVIQFQHMRKNGVLDTYQVKKLSPFLNNNPTPFGNATSRIYSSGTSQERHVTTTNIDNTSDGMKL